MLANGWIKVGKEIIGVDDAQDISHRHIPIAFREGGVSHTGSLSWNRVDGTWVK